MTIKVDAQTWEIAGLQGTLKTILCAKGWDISYSSPVMDDSELLQHEVKNDTGVIVDIVPNGFHHDSLAEPCIVKLKQLLAQHGYPDGLSVKESYRLRIEGIKRFWNKWGWDEKLKDEKIEEFTKIMEL